MKLTPLEQLAVDVANEYTNDYLTVAKMAEDKFPLMHQFTHSEENDAVRALSTLIGIGKKLRDQKN